MMKNNPKKVSLTDHMNNWLNDYLSNVRNFSSKTVSCYFNALCLFLDFLEEEHKIPVKKIDIKCLSRTYLEEWLKWLQEKRGNSKLTRDHRLAVIMSFLSYLQSRDSKYKLTYIEASGIKGISHGRGKIVEPLTKKGLKVFFECIDCSTKVGRRDFIMFTIMYDIGCRVGELLDIKLRDLFLDTDSPHVRIRGKGDKSRTMAFSDTTVLLIRRYIKATFGICPSPDAFLFHSSHNGIYRRMSTDAVNARLDKISSKAHAICPDVPLHMHSHQLRHSSATHWLLDNVNPAIISSALGHSSLSTTVRYLGISSEELRTALQKRACPVSPEEDSFTKVEGGLRSLIKVKK